MTLFIYPDNKKERALRVRYAVALANRWMGTPQTTHNGLIAHIYYYIIKYECQPIIN